jgi:hypothetical protein
MSDTTRDGPGRPPIHDRATIVSALCERVANGELVKAVAADLGVHPATIRKWCAEDTELGALYARAREDQAHALAEQALEIAGGNDALTRLHEQAVADAEDELRASGDKLWFQKVQELRAGVVQRDRMRVDTIKWLASKIAPRAYGERMTTEHTGEVKHEHRGSITWGSTEVPL